MSYHLGAIEGFSRRVLAEFPAGSGLARLRDISEAMRVYYEGSWGYYLLGASAAAAVLSWMVFGKLLPWWRRRRERRELFDSLCRAHELADEERRLLRRWGRQAGWVFPELLFFKKSVWDRLATEIREEAEAVWIRKKLFED